MLYMCMLQQAFDYGMLRKVLQINLSKFSWGYQINYSSCKKLL